MCESNKDEFLAINTNQVSIDKLTNNKQDYTHLVELLQKAVTEYNLFKRLDNRHLPTLRTKTELRKKSKFHKYENKNITATYNKKGLEKKLLTRLRKYIVAGEYIECLQALNKDRSFRVKYSSLFIAFRAGKTQKALRILESKIEWLDNTAGSRSVTNSDRYFMNRLMNIWEEITSSPATCSNDRDNSDGYSPCTSFIHACYKLLIDKDITQNAITGRAQKLIKLRKEFKNEN